jgi:hypothetical protein
MTTPLGWSPIRITPILSKGGGWNVDLGPNDLAHPPNYPTGTTVVAQLYPPDQDRTLPLAQWTVLDTWTGTIANDIITFRVPTTQTDVIPDKALLRIFLTIPGVPPYSYMHGTVKRDD